MFDLLRRMFRRRSHPVYEPWIRADNLDHPPLMFCEETMRRFRTHTRSPASIEWERMRARTWDYDWFRDTISWGDETDAGECSTCTEMVLWLIHSRSVRWGTNESTEFDRADLWENVLRHFPEWPGFQRLEKPAWHDEVREEGRRAYKDVRF